jgi:Polyketide cyclase / dehydrase and lipid transport
MKTRHVEGTATTTANPDQVYAVLVDRPSWPEWSALGRYEAVSGVEGEIGSVACFATRGIRSVERLVELQPNRRLSYELVSGLPMRDYRANVDLTPSSGGTSIRWASSFEPKIPGTGWILRAMMIRVLGGLATDLARRAESMARQP